MSEEKTEKISISMRSSLLAAIDSHVKNRSEYIVGLVTADLAAAGKLPGTPEAAARERFEEAIKVIGAERVGEVLAGVVDESLTPAP